ncbi:TetR family transcriptional regulator [Saccharomonospora sp. NPDC006951]
MPRPNPQRRDLLADASIRVLAEKGSHGLTHRAVDAAAGVPAGTTSRYFRTREALITGIVGRLLTRLDERVAAQEIRPLERTDLEEALVSVLTSMVADLSHEPLALFELHLEGTRDAEVRNVLAEALARRRALIVEQCAAAGIAISDEDAEVLEMGVLGIVFTGLTTGSLVGTGPATRTLVRGVLGRYPVG